MWTFLCTYELGLCKSAFCCSCFFFFFLMGLHEMFIASSQDDVIEILFHRKKLRERWFAVAEILN